MAVRELVHARARREVRRPLLASVQHDNQGSPLATYRPRRKQRILARFSHAMPDDLELAGEHAGFCGGTSSREGR
jgi:hypothetical protein